MESGSTRLKKNILSLFTLQAFNYLLPLITLPYLVRIIGPEKFGLINFAQVFITYFIIFTDYGFNLSATKEISIFRDDKSKVSEIYSAILILKLLIMILSLTIFIVLIFTLPMFKDNIYIYISTFGLVVGNVLFPIWLFQGIERMGYITYMNMVLKTISTISIFLLIKKEEDYYLLPLINSISSILIGIISLFIVSRVLRIKLLKISGNELLRHLKEGWHLFISTIAVSIYTITNTFLLGLIAGNIYVGYFTAADKITKALQGILAPVSQAVYPYVIKLFNTNTNGQKSKAFQFLNKYIKIVTFINVLIFLLVLIFSSDIVHLVLGEQYENSILILRILSIVPLILSLNHTFGTLIMIPLNYKKEFARIIVYGSIFNIFLSLWLINVFEAKGTALTIVLTETFVTVFMYYFIRRKGILKRGSFNV
ncbi:flippase [Paenibacillus pedocola]|uniref:flippase n=1 Tax=Paenibacillus pedocola TaxID=3242193 RepID=UPI002878008C|nr:flippase [Paenibacillus typhae]